MSALLLLLVLGMSIDFLSFLGALELGETNKWSIILPLSWMVESALRLVCELKRDMANLTLLSCYGLSLSLSSLIEWFDLGFLCVCFELDETDL